MLETRRYMNECLDDELRRNSYLQDRVEGPGDENRIRAKSLRFPHASFDQPHATRDAITTQISERPATDGRRLGHSAAVCSFDFSGGGYVEYGARTPVPAHEGFARSIQAALSVACTALDLHRSSSVVSA